jgi:hypothetical protein
VGDFDTADSTLVRAAGGPHGSNGRRAECRSSAL